MDTHGSHNWLDRMRLHASVTVDGIDINPSGLHVDMSGVGEAHDLIVSIAALQMYHVLRQMEERHFELEEMIQLIKDGLGSYPDDIPQIIVEVLQRALNPLHGADCKHSASHPLTKWLWTSVNNIEIVGDALIFHGTCIPADSWDKKGVGSRF